MRPHVPGVERIGPAELAARHLNRRCVRERAAVGEHARFHRRERSVRTRPDLQVERETGAGSRRDEVLAAREREPDRTAEGERSTDHERLDYAELSAEA